MLLLECTTDGRGRQFYPQRHRPTIWMTIGQIKDSEMALWISLYVVSIIPAYFISMYLFYKNSRWIDDGTYILAFMLAVIWPVSGGIFGFIAGTMALGEWTVSMIQKIEKAFEPPPVVPTPTPIDDLPD